MILFNTERKVPTRLDKAVKTIVCDREAAAKTQPPNSSSSAGALLHCSYQSCEQCNKYKLDPALPYIAKATLIQPINSNPLPLEVELRTRHPCFICSECSHNSSNQQQQQHGTAGSSAAAAAAAAAAVGVEEEPELHLCPVHVCAVYEMSAHHIKNISKSFVLHCPDCQHQSAAMSSQQEVTQHITAHLAAAAARGRPCCTLQAALDSGRYSSPAAFGYSPGERLDRPAAVEDAMAQLLARITLSELGF
ncbi:hypothetical protein OEZ86_001045 [Tetradesmus obliquus]|nr:hypothetical protein OEZ86_001045 [Tetradesmus obliquus]